MKSPEERITELEQRVALLESIIKKSEINRTPDTEVHDTVSQMPVNQMPVNQMLVNQMPVNQTQANQMPDNQIPNQRRSFNQRTAGSRSSTQRQSLNQRTNSSPQVNNKKDKEALIGKYIIGVLAAVLIFVGAISFIGLVWNRMTPGIKISLLAVSGIVLSAFGFWFLRTRRNPITSIILGTGAGLLFITILSANLAFHMIGNNLSIILAGFWAVLFMISTRYTKLFFTSVIAYIGSYITLILGLLLIKGDRDLLLLILFTTVITAVMFYTTFKGKNFEIIISIMMSFGSYSTILVRCYADGIFGNSPLLKGYLLQIAIVIILYILLNFLYKVRINTDLVLIYFVVSIVTTILTVFVMMYLNVIYLDISIRYIYLLFFAVNLVQFILNYILHKWIEKWLTIYYSIILTITALLINIELIGEPTGIVLIGLLLLACGKIFKREEQTLLIGAIVVVDSFFLLRFPTNNPICAVLGLIQLALMGYLLWSCVSLKRYVQLHLLKLFAVPVVIFSCFGIPSNIVRLFVSSSRNTYLDNITGYLLLIIAVIALIKIDYFKSWKNEQFKLFGVNESLENDTTLDIVLYTLTTGLYLYGLWGVTSSDKVMIQLIFTLAVVAVALLQTRIFLQGKLRNNTVTGIWIVLKYLILTWTILGSFLDLGFISVVYSITGLVVAIVSITVGFKLKVKSIRLYGLILTIIMVAKFILVDLIQENSITKVLALILGGGLCFFISYIYNKLSESTK